MTEEKMVDLDTTGEGQEVELQEEESTKEEKVEEEKVEVSSEDPSKEETNEEDPKDDGLDKYSKNVQRRIKKLLDRVEKTELREQEALRFAENAKKKYEEYETKIKSLDENYIAEFQTEPELVQFVFRPDR